MERVVYSQDDECINQNDFLLYLLVVVLFAPRVDLSDNGVSDFFGVFDPYGFPFLNKSYIINIIGT